MSSPDAARQSWHRCGLLAETQAIAHVGTWEWDVATGTMSPADELGRMLWPDPSIVAPTSDSRLARVHEGDLTRVRAILDATLAVGRSYSLVTRIRRPDGAVRWVESSGAPVVVDGVVKTLASTVVDVTARELAQASQRRTEVEYLLIAEHEQEATWVVDPEGVATSANEQLALMLARPVEELIGSPISAFLDDAGSSMAGERVAGLGLADAKRFDVSFVRPDGSTIWTTLTFAPVDDGHGGFGGAVATLIDITERRRAESALRVSAPGAASEEDDRIDRPVDVVTQPSDVRRRALEDDLRSVELGADMTLHYQPLVDLRDGRLTGFEALLRWAHPQRGMIAPDDFIRIAEETGQIVEIGRWVVREACRQSQEWQRTFPACAGLVMNVNVSAVQLADADVVHDVARALELSRLDPELLTLEITETMVLEEETDVGDALHQLKELGVRISVDDFGTCSSLLGHLDWSPVDELKIDRSLVARLGEETEDAAVPLAVIGLARSRQVEVVAEGIEREDQLAQLRGAGCTRGQGYYFWRPLDVAAVEVLLEDVLRPVLPPEPAPFVMLVTDRTKPSHG